MRRQASLEADPREQVNLSSEEQKSICGSDCVFSLGPQNAKRLPLGLEAFDLEAGLGLLS